MIVYPSGAAFAVNSAPTPPPAPGLFSTMTGWPSAAVSFSPMVRARMSVVPPGANGTTHLMGLPGQDCAPATVVPAHSASASVTTARARTIVPPRMATSLREERAHLWGGKADRSAGRREIGPRLVVDRHAARKPIRAHAALHFARREHRLRGVDRRGRL